MATDYTQWTVDQLLAEQTRMTQARLEMKKEQKRLVAVLDEKLEVQRLAESIQRQASGTGAKIQIVSATGVETVEFVGSPGAS